MSTSPFTSSTIARTDYSMAMDKDTLTMVVGDTIGERLKTISAAVAVKPDWSKKQCASVERPVSTSHKSPKPLHPAVSLEPPGELEAKVLEITKLPPESCVQSLHSRKRKTPAMHAKFKRLRSNAPSHNLTGQRTGLTVTAAASKADTSPSPCPPVSNVNEAVIADNIEAISNKDVSTLKNTDPLSYYTTSEKDFVDHAKEHPWGPENASKEDSTLKLREMDPLSYFCITEDNAVNNIQGSPSTRNTPTHNREATTTKDINLLGYFSTVEKNAFQEVNKGQSLPSPTEIPKTQELPESQSTSDLGLEGRNTFTIIRPYLNPRSQQQERPRQQSNNAFTPSPASNFISPPTVSPSTLAPTLRATTTLKITTPSPTTI
ncbi:MAG: hypothetical protein Q9180_007180, partial [Flavoplaca navasiana]